LESKVCGEKKKRTKGSKDFGKKIGRGLGFL